METSDYRQTTDVDNQINNEPDNAENKERPEKFDDIISKTRKQISDTATNMARTKLEGFKTKSQENMGCTANAFRKTANQLREENNESIAQYPDWAAEKIDEAVTYLQNRSVEDLLSDFRRVTRRNPGLALGSALMAGFLTARFVSSSKADKSRNVRSGDFNHVINTRTYE